MLLAVLNGTDTDQMVLESSFKISNRTKNTIIAVYVIIIPRDKPLDQDIPNLTEKGERILQNAETLASDFKMKIRTQMLQARSKGVAVVNYVIEESVDLLITGIDKTLGGRKLFLDSDTEYILLNSASKVITCRL
jgi:nucleotide-binding universal stress UspA family protein